MLADNIDDLWRRTLELLLRQVKRPSRAGEARETIGAHVTLTDPDQSFVTNARRKLSPCYWGAELLWYLSGERAIDRVVAYAPQYSKFARPDGTAYGAYGERIKRHGQLTKVMNLLQLRPDTRQAIVCMWESFEDLQAAYDGDELDVPCTTTWQFLLRDARLHMVVTMRSNDAWLGMPNDVAVNCAVLRVVASMLNVEIGTYTHNVGSLHLYERDAEKAREALVAPDRPESKAHKWRLRRVNILDVSEACRRETENRGCKRANLNGLSRDNRDPLNDAVACCATRWSEYGRSDVSSPVLREALSC